jgi:NitT/TauT family transport system permease protein
MATDQALHGLDNLEVRPLPGHELTLSRLARRSWAVVWPKVLAIALVLAAWQLFYLSNFHGDSADHLVVGPVPGLKNLWGQLAHGQLMSGIGTTMQTALVGYALSVLVGVVVGAVVSRIPPLRAAVGSIITGLTTMPSIAWFPFAIILFGLSNSAILFVIVLGSAPSIANGLIAGVDYTPPLLLRAGKMMGLRRFSLYRYLILPASLPSFIAGLKQAWAFAWRSLMAGELVVQVAGALSLGVLLQGDQDQLDLTSAISVMIVILLLGVIVDGLFSKLDLMIRSRRGLLDPASAA